jgi:5-methylcytosine-specific restriction endonuclease McrA
VPYSNNEERREKNRVFNIAYRRRLQARRLALIDRLGGKCFDCHATVGLEVDHVVVDKPSRMREKSHVARILEYEAQEKKGNAMVRCKVCNGSKQDRFGHY